MSGAIVVAVGLVGGCGAVARYVVDGAVTARLGARFPFGTLAVNLSGAFLLGFLVGLAPDGETYDVAGTGLVGAYTTFSTWALESHRLAEDGRARTGALNFAVSLLLGVALAWAGRELASVL